MNYFNNSQDSCHKTPPRPLTLLASLISTFRQTRYGLPSASCLHPREVTCDSCRHKPIIGTGTSRKGPLAWMLAVCLAVCLHVSLSCCLHVCPIVGRVAWKLAFLPYGLMDQLITKNEGNEALVIRPNAICRHPYVANEGNNSIMQPRQQY